jgi:Fe-S-cluster-containing dehydrogenase component/anaerobic selenocysteine-containing dehydrogenase
MPEVNDELKPKAQYEKLDNKDPNYWDKFKDLYEETFANENNQDISDEKINDASKTSVLSRRKFLALVGASAALAGAGCSDYRSKGHIIPYNKMPEDVVVGKANYYASTSTVCGHSCGVLIKTREGRPIKVDGNPDHPISKGKTCAKCQANILRLYDPERLEEPLRKMKTGGFIKSTWQHADNEILDALSNVNDKQIAIVSHKIISPTGKKILDDFISKYPTTKVYTYELFNEETRNSAWKKCYGSETFPLIKWNEARVILGLESDFLGTDGDKVETVRLYTEGRDIHNTDKFNRLYVVEGNMSITGMNADYRLRLRPDAQYEFVMSLLNEIVNKTNAKTAVGSQVLNSFSLDEFAKKYSLSSKKLNLLVNDLLDNKGASIIYAGKTLSEEVHIAVNLLNDILDNKSLYRTDAIDVSLIPLSTKDDLTNLVKDMKAGNIAVLFHYDSNPVYHLPKDYGFEEALDKVPMVVSLVESKNESSVKGNYILPINHDFESWGDAKTRTGFYAMQQPVIDPIFHTKQKEVALLTWLNGKPVKFDEMLYHDYMSDHWEKDIYPTLNTKMTFTELWNSALHDGVVFVDETPAKFGDKLSDFAIGTLPPNNSKKSDFVVLLRESYSSGDGRFLNNGWMQELPHPVSKVTWDNYAAISHSTAKALDVDSNDLIKVKVGNRELEIPVFIQPGNADNTIAIELGYGRTVVGVVGTGVGFDAIPLMSKSGGLSPWLYENAKVTKGDGSYKLISSVEQVQFESDLTKDVAQKRNIIREGTLAEYVKNPKFIRDKEEQRDTLYNKHLYPGIKWAMAVDLNKCIGCGECVIACNAENNIPIVGKDQVAVSREMEWLRVDRYYSGTIDEPIVSNQLMLCQQCDDAPCENVCPVAATTHSPDGLNQMIYNRCVGTRYCSNNCPYKVRRFNFYNFRDRFKDAYQQSHLLSLVYNPEVTVRSRGVMEKCTFCIQRIMEARSDAIRDNREIKGSDVTTACQDACSTYAIHFGDMNDKNSEFYKYRNHELGYYVLEDLNTFPNVTYLAKLRNTHTEEV